MAMWLARLQRGHPEMPEFQKKAAHNGSKLSPKKDKEDTALTGNMEQGNF